MTEEEHNLLVLSMQLGKYNPEEEATIVYKRFIKPLELAIKNYEELMQKRESYLAENNRIDKYCIERKHIRERWFTDNDGYFGLVGADVGVKVVGFGKDEEGYYLELYNSERHNLIIYNEIPDSTLFQITRIIFRVLQKYEKPPLYGTLVAMFGERPVYRLG